MNKVLILIFIGHVNFGHVFLWVKLFFPLEIYIIINKKKN